MTHNPFSQINRWGVMVPAAPEEARSLARKRVIWAQAQAQWDRPPSPETEWDPVIEALLQELLEQWESGGPRVTMERLRSLLRIYRTPLTGSLATAMSPFQPSSRRLPCLTGVLRALDEVSSPESKGPMPPV